MGTWVDNPGERTYLEKYLQFVKQDEVIKQLNYSD